MEDIESKVVGCVFSCGKDEGCIKPFLEAWNRVSKIRLVLVSDITDPVKEDFGLKVYNSEWPSKGPIAPSVIEILKVIAEDEDTPYVMKLDCDTLHLSTKWLSEMQEGDKLFGMQQIKRPDCVMGCVYIIERNALNTITEDTDTIKVRAEDVGVSKLMQKHFPEDIGMYPTDGPRRKICGWGPNFPDSAYRKYWTIHVGQRHPSRDRVPIEMRRMLRQLT